MPSLSEAQLPPAVASALAAFQQAARGAFGDRLLEMWLFGSYARGEARPDSDVDVLLVLAEASWRDKRTASDLAVDIMLESFVDVAPMVMSPAELEQLRRDDRLLARDIDTEGVRL